MGSQEKVKTRRGNNEGSIWPERDEKGNPVRWRAAVTVGYKDNGQPMRKTLSGKTRKIVKEKLNQYLKDKENNINELPGNIKTGEWLERWLYDYKRNNVKPSTFESYEAIINTHLIPALKNIPLKRLKAANLQQLYTEKLESGGKNNKPLSTRYVRYMHTLIREALQQAMKEKLVPYNIADAAKPPKLESKEMVIFSEEQVDLLLEAIQEDRYCLAYTLAIATGLRRGELLGLCWDCVDLNNESITVIRQLIALDNKPVLDSSLKTKQGKRNIPLPKGMADALKEHRKNQNEERLAWGEAYTGNPYNLVFTREDGSPLDPKEFTKRFQRLCEKAGLPRIRLHDLRHTHASLLLKKNIHPKVVQERLGHSSINITLDLYSHVTPSLQQEAADSFGDLFDKKKNASK